VTDDQQFVLGILGILSTTVIQLVAYRKLHQNSELLNGLGIKRERRARRAGAASQRASDTRSRAAEKDQG